MLREKQGGSPNLDLLNFEKFVIQVINSLIFINFEIYFSAQFLKYTILIR